MLSSEYTLIKMAADWCMPCCQMEPIVKKALEGFDNVSLIEVNVDKEPDMARKYKVRSIPMLVLIKGDNIIGTMVGAKSVNEIKAFLQTA